MFTTYILKTNDDRYYIGQTQDIQQRLIRHNRGECRFTKLRLPVTLVYQREFNSRGEAIKHEKNLKAAKNITQLKKLIKAKEGPIV